MPPSVAGISRMPGRIRPDRVADFVGIRQPDRRYKVLQTQARTQRHPAAYGVKNFKVKDEFYYRLKFTPEAGSSPASAL